MTTSIHSSGIATVTINTHNTALPPGAPGKVWPGGRVIGVPVPAKRAQAPKVVWNEPYDFNVDEIKAAHAAVTKMREVRAEAARRRERAEHEQARAETARQRASASVAKVACSLLAGETFDVDCSGARALLKAEAWRLAVAEAGEQESGAAADVQAAERAVNAAIAGALRIHADELVEKHEASGAFNDLAVVIALSDAVNACDPPNPMLRDAVGLSREPFGFFIAVVRANAVAARVDPDRIDIRSPKILRAAERYTTQIRSLMLPAT